MSVSTTCSNTVLLPVDYNNNVSPHVVEALTRQVLELIAAPSSLQGHQRYDGRLNRSTGWDAVIVTFSTRVGAFTMHGDAAMTLLRAMGHSGTVPGAILAADLPAALRSCAHARGPGGRARAPPAIAPAESDDDDEEKREPPIPLRTRAVPLLEMIETAIARDSDLMCGERG